jgi:hypothetical protein
MGRPFPCYAESEIRRLARPISIDQRLSGGRATQQYRGFQAFEKTGSSTWTLTGTQSGVTSWTIAQGALSISSDGVLGDPLGGLILNGAGYAPD